MLQERLRIVPKHRRDRVSSLRDPLDGGTVLLTGKLDRYVEKRCSSVGSGFFMCNKH